MSHDSYLDNISNESLAVLQRFGAGAPHKLSVYACQLEDELKQALGTQTTLRQQLAYYREQVESLVPRLQAVEETRQAMEAILTNPDELNQYVSRFFGPEGPYPGGAVISRCQGGPQGI
jgi:hypothetical protein